jgi:hypothetical protein
MINEPFPMTLTLTSLPYVSRLFSLTGCLPSPRLAVDLVQRAVDSLLDCGTFRVGGRPMSDLWLHAHRLQMQRDHCHHTIVTLAFQLAHQL